MKRVKRTRIGASGDEKADRRALGDRRRWQAADVQRPKPSRKPSGWKFLIVHDWAQFPIHIPIWIVDLSYG
jgi:hypothetical protein